MTSLHLYAYCIYLRKASHGCRDPERKDDITEKAETLEPTELIEKATQAGKEYAATVSAAAMAGLASAFDLQNAGIQASRTFADQWATSLREGQAQATKIAEVSVQLVGRAFDTK